MTIMERLIEHYNEALEYFPKDNIVGIFVQGSQNYNLDLPTSDLDTKLIVTPTLSDIVLNKKPVSTTHVRANDEHIDFKDVRLYMETFRKQNLNFLEILFTDYVIINPLYEAEWNRLVAARENIARMNPMRAVKSMKGVALEKFHALKHPYPSKLDILAKYGYDPKQLHHLLRVEKYLIDYILGELSYKECLTPTGDFRKFLLDVKTGKYNLERAEEMANSSVENVEKIEQVFVKYAPDKECQENPEMRALLEDVQTNIMKISIKKELM